VIKAIAGRPVRSTAVLAIVLVVSFAFSTVAKAAPGDLDPTFSVDGKQMSNFGPGFSEASAVVRQPDGKIVAVGANDSSALPPGFAFALARYDPNGSLDPSFSGNGKQTTDFAGRGGGYGGVALQPDGKIVAVGRVGVGGFALARYNPNGSLDPSFSGDGKRTTSFCAEGCGGASGVAIQADGKIVVVGSRAAHGMGDVDFALARYNPNGSLDPSFSGDGKQTTGFGGLDFASAVALQAHGKIVAVGSRDHVFALARYNPNGSLDPTFSGDGKRTTDFGASMYGANGVASQANGKIVAVGDATDGNFALARYTPNGSLDPSFSGDGKQTTGFGGSASATGANAVAIRTDGKIVAIGETGHRDFALARYDPNGSLDPRFSGDGKQTTSFGGLDAANGVALFGDGTIVAGGTVDLGNHGAFALARYRANGSPDPSFSGDGKQTTGFGGPDEGNAVAIQANGRIVAVGGAASRGFGLARFTPNGSLDPTFSGDGMQTTDSGGILRANGVALQADGRIVAVGSARYGFGLARYNPNGSLDPSFSGDGVQTTNFGCVGGCADANGVAIQANGRIVAVGIVDSGGGFALARFKPNGSLDTSFSGDGMQTTYSGRVANAVAIQADGKIVVVGSSDSAAFTLARYNANGFLDPSFSGDGVQTTDFGGSGEATGVAIQADGKIVTVGYAGGDFALARYNPNGSLDPSFSSDGMQTTDFGGDDRANGVALQANGRIVAVGDAVGHGFALGRYNPNGSLDPRFSGDGKRTTDFGSGDGANGVALQANGKIVAVGSGLGTDLSSDFVVARYLAG
jgi:uncharacterized delta-60 repeat protein